MDVSRTDVKKAHKDVLKGIKKGDNLRLSKEAERLMGMRSTYYLAKHILGYNKLDDNFHVKLCNYFDEHFFANQFHNHPRKHFKTTTAIARNIRHSLIDPNVSIGIMMNNLDSISAVFRGMKSHYLDNKKFRSLYPEHAVKKSKEEGTKARFTTPARKATWKPSPTFMGFSAEKSVVSFHFDFFMFDDLVDGENSTSVDMMDKVYQCYQESLIVAGINKFQEPWHMVIGTRWHFYDPYHRMLQNQKNNPNFHILITQAEWYEIHDGKKVYKSLCPGLYSKEWIDYQRNELKDYLFSCHFLNNPVPEGSRAMDPNKIKEYDPDVKIISPLNYCICVDAASSLEKREGDPTVISAFSMDSSSNIRVMEVRKGWWDLDEIIHQIIDCHKLHNIRTIGVESNAFQRWLEQALEKEKKEKQLNFRIEKMKRSRYSKKKGEGSRLERIIYFLNEGKIHIKRDEPEKAYIRKELAEYPHGRWDHFMDTLADAIVILKAPGEIRHKAVQYRVPPHLSGRRDGFQTGYNYRAND